jgi:MFS family permease
MRLVRNIVNDIQAKSLFFKGSILIAIIPLLWMVSSDFKYLLILEIFTGFAWGIFEIIFLLTVFQKLTPDENSSYMMSFNFIHSLVMGLGTIAGALTLKYINFTNNQFLWIFAISAVLRLFAMLLFPDFKLKKVKIKILPFLRPMGARPNIGLMERPSWRLIRLSELRRKKNEAKDSKT